MGCFDDYVFTFDPYLLEYMCAGHDVVIPINIDGRKKI